MTSLEPNEICSKFYFALLMFDPIFTIVEQSISNFGYYANLLRPPKLRFWELYERTLPHRTTFRSAGWWLSSWASEVQNTVVISQSSFLSVFKTIPVPQLLEKSYLSGLRQTRSPFLMGSRLTQHSRLQGHCPEPTQ